MLDGDDVEVQTICPAGFTVRQVQVPPRLIRQVHASLIVFAIVLLMLGAAIASMYMVLDRLDESLTRGGTEPGNKIRAAICQGFVNDGEVLPDICFDPEVSKYLKASPAELPGSTP